MASLRIIGGLNSGRSFAVDQAENLIGREPWCDVLLNSRTVSRQHARILREPDGYFIEDLDSVNGTSVNGRRLERRTALEHGDRVQIYDTVLLFQIDHAAPPSGAAPEPAANVAGTTGDDSQHQIVSQIDVQDQGSAIQKADSEKKLTAILKIAKNLGASLEVHEILTHMLETLFELFPNVRTGYVLQVTAVGIGLAPLVVKSRGDASATVSPIGLKIARRVMTEGLAFLTATPLPDADRTEAESSIFEEELRSIMCAPLIGPSRTSMGVIELVSLDPQCPFLPADLEVLSIVAILVGQAVENARLHESLLELDRRRREISLAKNIQLHFLPTAAPDISDYRFFHHYAAADSVAGDYFDYIPLPDGRWGIALGDVSGKGISAALLMARLCSDVRFCLLTSPTPEEAVNQLNRLVCEHVKGNAFITLVLFVLDIHTHELTVVNAGHPQPLIRNAETACQHIMSLDDVCLPLGITPEVSYIQRTIPLEIGDLVLAFTDGVSEANNPEGELLGPIQIQEVLNRTKSVPTYAGRALLADLREFVQGQPPSDDICIVSFGRNEP